MLDIIALLKQYKGDITTEGDKVSLSNVNTLLSWGKPKAVYCLVEVKKKPNKYIVHAYEKTYEILGEVMGGYITKKEAIDECLRCLDRYRFEMKTDEQTTLF